MNEPTLKKAMETLEFLGQDREGRRLYEKRAKVLHDEASMIELGQIEQLLGGHPDGTTETSRMCPRAREWIKGAVSRKSVYADFLDSP
ncbi:hypothetical protein [Paenibacillus sp. RC84]|uniref:hypothetical protein n=1 Tax=Paenibacillus sp. RC84 TaxID=3156252 RepID=UPI0035147631